MAPCLLPDLAGTQARFFLNSALMTLSGSAGTKMALRAPGRAAFADTMPLTAPTAFAMPAVGLYRHQIREVEEAGFGASVPPVPGDGREAWKQPHIEALRALAQQVVEPMPEEAAPIISLPCIPPAIPESSSEDLRGSPSQGLRGAF